MNDAPCTTQLLRSVQDALSLEDVEKQKQIAQFQSSARMKAVQEWWEKLQSQWAETEGELLREWIGFAFLGACVGYVERNLHPLHPEHQYIYKQIIRDVTDVFQTLHDQKIEYDPNYIKYQVYDYGVQCIYYLDWDLYMSKECY